MQIIPYFLILIMGLILGLMGGGGSILSVPILIYGFGISASTASGYSLFLVGSTALFGTLIYGLKKQVNWKIGLLFSMPALVAAFSTRKFLIPLLPDLIFDFADFSLSKNLLILTVFVVTMLVSSFAMIKIRPQITEENKLNKTHKRVNVVEVVVKSFGIGILTGFIGAGGGFLIVPALIFLLGLDTKTATATSLFVISFSSLFGFLAEVSSTTIQWNLLLSLLLLALIGNILGIFFNKFISGQKLKKSFGYFTLLVAIFITVQETSKILN
jgi:uncharacterized membrane protein YfcA